MIGFPLGKIVAIMILLLFLIVLVFIVMRRWRSKKKEKQLEELKQEFGKEAQTKIPETPEKDKEILENIINKISEGEEEGKKSVKIDLGKEYSLRMETPDVIALKTPQTTLHKGFDSIRIKKIEETENGIEIHIQ